MPDRKQKAQLLAVRPILNDVYLSMGFASRIIHLYPRKQNPKESHVVNAVYSNDLNKWVFMDPDMRGCFMDEQGQLLGVQEIRQCMISGDPLAVNDDIVPWVKRLGKNFYKWYISKNIFRYDCPQHSVFDYESQAGGRVYIQLIPDGCHEDWLLEPRTTERGNTIVYVNDATLFWQASFVSERKGPVWFPHHAGMGASALYLLERF